MRKPAPRSPRRFAAGTRTSVVGHLAVGRPAAAAVSERRHRLDVDARGVGGNDDLARAASRLGVWLGNGHDDPERAPSAPEENHLRPLITHSSPSSIAVVRRSVGSAPGDVRLGHREERAVSPATSGSSQRSFCSAVPNWCRISPLPASGAWQLKTYCAHSDAADLLIEVGVGEEALPVPPASGGRCGAQRPRCLRTRAQFAQQLVCLVVLPEEPTSSGKTCSFMNARYAARCSDTATDLASQVHDAHTGAVR